MPSTSLFQQKSLSVHRSAHPSNQKILLIKVVTYLCSAWIRRGAGGACDPPEFPGSEAFSAFCHLESNISRNIYSTCPPEIWILIQALFAGDKNVFGSTQGSSPGESTGSFIKSKDFSYKSCQCPACFSGEKNLLPFRLNPSMVLRAPLVLLCLNILETILKTSRCLSLKQFLELSVFITDTILKQREDTGIM